jgi:hypothetical protein
MRTAGKAIGSVVAGLASGNPDSIGDKVEARAQEVRDRVQVLCTTLRDLHATQEALAGGIEAFRPYATITTGDVDDCR